MGDVRREPIESNRTTDPAGETAAATEGDLRAALPPFVAWDPSVFVSNDVAETRTVGVAFVAVEGCACPVPDGAEWTLRYGTTEAREAQRLGVASIVSAFAHLLDPNVTQGDALASLKRLRRAQVTHSGRDVS